jgi:hypothetical protein
MSIACMRDYVTKQYPGKKWEQKVTKMADKQVMAIYHNLLNRRKENCR